MHCCFSSFAVARIPCRLSCDLRGEPLDSASSSAKHNFSCTFMGNSSCYVTELASVLLCMFHLAASALASSRCFESLLLCLVGPTFASLGNGCVSITVPLVICSVVPGILLDRSVSYRMSVIASLHFLLCSLVHVFTWMTSVQSLGR